MLNTMIISIVEFIKNDPEAGSKAAEQMIVALAQSQKTYQLVIDSVAGDVDYRIDILRVIVQRAGQLAPPAVGKAPKRPQEEPTDRILGFFRENKNDSYPRDTVRLRLDIPENEFRAAFNKVFETGHVTKVGSGRGTTYKYKP